MQQLATGLMTVIGAVLLSGCGKEPPIATTTGSPPVILKTGLVELREVDLTYTAEAVVEAVRQSTIAAQIAGRIVELRFDVGDYVKQGEVIVRIDERAATQAVAASEAQVIEAQAALANARAQFERSKVLVAQKFLSSAALDKVEADYKAAQARVSALLAGAGQAATERSFTTIVAPYSGVVPAADPRTHTTRVRLDLRRESRDLYPGVFARAHFTIGKTTRLLAPREAIIRRSEVTAVYVIDDQGAPHLRQVRLGAISDDRSVEVLAGVKPGERVAIEPMAAGMSARPAPSR